MCIRDRWKCKPGLSVVRFQSADGLILRGDFLAAANPERGAIITVHMNAQGWDRSSWPMRSLLAFQGLDASVLSFDRRGAGTSEGKPENAAKSPSGRLDLEAAVQFLLRKDNPCPIDPNKILVIGVGDGTATTLDYVANTDQVDPVSYTHLTLPTILRV